MEKRIPATRNMMSAILLLSFTASFMLFMQSPLSLFFQAPYNFVLGLNVLFPWYLVFMFTGFAILSIVLVLLWKQKLVIGLVLLALLALIITFARFNLGAFSSVYIYMLFLVAFAMIVWMLAIKLLKDKAIDCALLLLLGGIFAAYIQMLFLNGNMVIIGENTAPYSALSLANIMNSLIWLLIAIAPLVLWLFFRKRRKELEITKELAIITAVVLCVQVGILTATAIATPRHGGFDESMLHLVYEPVVDLNSEENIVVFLLDSLGTDAMMEVLEKYPELNYQLDGFTFYRNNIANYRQTLPSVTTMLTQHYYEDHTLFGDFFEYAWSQESFIDTLRANGFRINLLLDQGTTYGSTVNLIGKADNLRFPVPSYISTNIADILRSTSRISAGIFAPYLMKELFLFGIPMDFGNGFVEFFSYDYTFQFPHIGTMTDLAFYESVRRNAFTIDNEYSVFSFIFLLGAHQTSWLAFDTASGSIYQGAGFDEVSAIRASFHIMNAYFEYLREAGIYDNTTIIILSDHPPRGHSHKRTTPLLIKPRGATGRLESNDEAELTDRYFGASILQIAGLPHEHLGLSYFDIIGGALPPPRFFYYHTCAFTAGQDGSNAIELERVYEVTGDANNPDNWRVVD